MIDNSYKVCETVVHNRIDCKMEDTMLLCKTKIIKVIFHWQRSCLGEFLCRRILRVFPWLGYFHWVLGIRDWFLDTARFNKNLSYSTWRSKCEWSISSLPKRSLTVHFTIRWSSKGNHKLGHHQRSNWTSIVPTKIVYTWKKDLI